MGSLQELGLDFTISSKIVSDFVAQVSGNFSESDKISKLEEYINGFQDEMKKVEAFKSALPLVRLLVNDVFGELKEELARCKGSKPVLVFEEFIPLKDNCIEEKDKKVESSKGNDIIKNTEKRNWLSHVQLWNSDNNQNHYPNTDLCNNTPILKLGNNNKKRTKEEMKVKVMDDLFQSGENSSFMPLKRCMKFPVMPVGKNDKDEVPGVPRLSLCTPEIKKPREEINSIGFSPRSSSNRSDGRSNFKAIQPQTTRKQRRCWSPELRRRFLDAIQQLGGGQAATPKQIRELMQVDGLTNDEVKSHLQKYRMHNLKPTTTTNTWVSQEQCGEYVKTRHSQSGSPQGPLHLTGSSQVTSMTGSYNMEDEEVEKSENHRWKMQIQLSGRDNV